MKKLLLPLCILLMSCSRTTNQTITTHKKLTPEQKTYVISLPIIAVSFCIFMVPLAIKIK